MRNKPAFTGLIILILLLTGGYYVYEQMPKEASAPSVEDSQSTSQNSQPRAAGQPAPAPATTAPATLPPSPKKTAPQENTIEGVFSTGEEGQGADVLVMQTDYDGTVFSPSTLNIKVGDYVIFKNNSSKNFWPVSSDAMLPELDAKKEIVPGGKFTLQFKKAGVWKFQDKINTEASGTVIVK